MLANRIKYNNNNNRLALERLLGYNNNHNRVYLSHVLSKVAGIKNDDDEENNSSKYTTLQSRRFVSSSAQTPDYRYNMRRNNKNSSAPLISSSFSSSYDRSGTLSSRHQHYHTSTIRHDSSGMVAIAVLGIGSISAVAMAGSYAFRGYREWQENQPTPEELEQMEKEAAAEAAKQKAADDAEKQKREKEEEKAKKKQQDNSEGGEKRENIFATWFGMDVGTNYYEGGFEDEMTRKEAALILGVRESSSASRIKEAHRKLLVLNHPDTGGSTYIAGKINEAKELLLKNKQKD